MTSWSEVISTEGDDCLIRVWAKPRASRSRIVGLRDGRIEVQLAAPPVDGAANEQLVQYLSKVLAVSKSRVRLEKGEASRNKVIRVRGIHAAEVEMRLFPAKKSED